MKCKDCGSFICPHRTTDAEKECYFSEHVNEPIPNDYFVSNGIPQDPFIFNYTDEFRREAAKDILCAIIRHDGAIGENQVEDAVFRRGRRVLPVDDRRVAVLAQDGDRLRDLDLRGNANITALPANAGDMKALRTLTLAGCGIPKEERDRIRQALPDCVINF